MSKQLFVFYQNITPSQDLGADFQLNQIKVVRTKEYLEIEVRSN